MWLLRVFKLISLYKNPRVIAWLKDDDIEAGIVNKVKVSVNVIKTANERT